MAIVKFIGTGCWQGIPAPFKSDALSDSVEWNSKDFRFRTSLVVSTKAGKNLLFEITPDIRIQSWKYSLDVPDAIFISHWHWDHMFGLLDVEWQAESTLLKLYGNKTTQQWYHDRFSHINANFNVFDENSVYEFGEIEVQPISVDHVEGTHGFLIKNTETNKSLAYTSDFHSLPRESLKKISASDFVTVDATYLDSRVDDDPTHIHTEAFQALVRELHKPKKIMVNISSHQGFKHNDWVAKYPDIIVPYDGIEIEL